jgi:hypothetical protein
MKPIKTINFKTISSFSSQQNEFHPILNKRLTYNELERISNRWQLVTCGVSQHHLPLCFRLAAIALKPTISRFLLPHTIPS